MTPGKMIGPIIISVLLVAAGLYLRTDGTSTAAFLGTAFVVIGVLSFIGNLGLYLAARRERG